MFSSLWSKLKELLRKMIGVNTIQKTLHIEPIISSKMANAIELWSLMYEDNSPWLQEPTLADPVKVTSLGLPAFIASEKARMATIEMKSEITTPTESVTEANPNYEPPTVDEDGNLQISNEPEFITKEVILGDTARAEYLNTQYTKVKNKIRNQLEYGIAKGGLVIKPYIVISDITTDGENTDTENNIRQDVDIEFDYIHADNFFPIAFDGSGKITEAAFVQVKTDKSTVYTRLEYHKLQNNMVTVTNLAFKKENRTQPSTTDFDSDLGEQINLTEVPEWADLQPVTQIGNVDRLLFAYFKMPEANTIEAHSPLGVSGYSRAVKLIKEADLQYSRMLWEFQGGELAIDIDRDALNTVEDEEKNTYEIPNMLQARLMRRVDLGNSETYQVFNPPYRDASLINGLNNILMRIEDVCALSRGTLSDVAAEARTATELKILKQRSYSANAEIQKALEDALKDLVYVMDIYCTLYEVTAPGEYDISFEWDDSILVDVETELNKRITLMQNGLASKLETRMWYFGETERQAREALNNVSQENKQSMEENLSNIIGGK
jgi:A118 family predicted phage portal protein|nr:MAG TPA: portal protein [Caudoviricetes sp.]